MKAFTTLTTRLLALVSAFAPLPVLAQGGSQAPVLFDRKDATPPPIGLPNLINGFENITIYDALSMLIGFLALIGGIAAFAFIIYGGFKYITSGPNPAGAEEGKRMIIGAIVGMVIIALSYVMVFYIIDTLRDIL